MSLLKLDRIDSNITSLVTFLKSIVTPQVTTNVVQADQIDTRTVGGNPTFLTSPLVPTPTTGDNSTKVASTAFTIAQISASVGIANAPSVKTALNASGSAPIYACRAWVNFNGTGTVTSMYSGNVSSVADNGVGQYTVNMGTAMQDTLYSTQVTAKYNGSSVPVVCNGTAPNTTTTTTILIINWSGGALMDSPEVSVTIVR